MSYFAGAASGPILDIEPSCGHYLPLSCEWWFYSLFIHVGGAIG